MNMIVVLASVLLKLGAPFSDHAVLQRDQPVVIWGWAEPKAEVTVSFAGQEKKTGADEQGRWRLELDPMPASKTPRDLVVTAVNAVGNPTIKQSNNQAILHDILVGEVWLASGQSNMEMPMIDANKRFRDKMGALVSQWASNANLRVICSPWRKVVSGRVRCDSPAQWNIATHEFLATNCYSALAYYFGRELEATLDVPVGVMAAYVGGTPIESWVPDCGWDSVRDDLFVATNILPSVSRRRTEGCAPRSWPEYPGDLWNELVAPLAPYSARGMIWYQGESNIEENHFGRIAYSKNMRALMDGWRKEFGCPGLKLLFVELAPFSYFWYKLEANDDRLARLCDEQRRFAASEPDAYLTCISDIGDLNDIHPCRKLEVALRLAGLAFQHVYGLPVKADPPQAVSARLVAPGRVEIELAHGEGLYRWMSEVSLWTSRQKESSPIRFADASGRVVDCESVIDGGKIVAASLEMVNPKYVEFLRRATDESNIYNASALPLGTFKLEVKEK